MQQDEKQASCAESLKDKQVEPVPGPVLHAVNKDAAYLRLQALCGSAVDLGASAAVETCLGPECGGSSNENVGTSSSEDESPSDRRSILLQAKIRGFHLPMPRPHPADMQPETAVKSCSLVSHGADDDSGIRADDDSSKHLQFQPEGNIYSSNIMRPGFGGFKLLEGEYRRLTIVGEGSFASVFSSTWRDAKVAVKKVRPESDFTSSSFDYQDVVESLRHELEVRGSSCVRVRLSLHVYPGISQLRQS